MSFRLMAQPHGGRAMILYGRELLQRLKPDNTIMIESTWYGGDFEINCKDAIDFIKPEKIILVSFHDQPIVKQSMFDQPVYEVGYYDSPYFIDFWAHVVANKYTLPTDEELLNHKTVIVPYLSYNRKPHEHRVRFYNQLVDADIHNKGIVSMDKLQMLEDDVTPYLIDASVSDHNIPNDILTLGQPNLWCSSFMNIVTETWYDINRACFVSEKIYKPIVGLRPFLVYAPDLGCKWLQDRGFETYENDFLDCYGKTVTADNLIDFLTVLSDLANNTSWLQTKFLALREKMLYNKQQFYKYVNNNNIDQIIESILND